MKTECLDAELLAAFAERRVKRSEMPAILAHLDCCEECTSTLRATLDLMEPPSRSRQWLAIAAAIAAIVVSAPFAWRATRTTPIGRLAALVPRSARVVEPRLSGPFAWAPYRGALRATGNDSDAQRMKLIGATGELVERADADHSSSSQHAAGVGLLLSEKPEEAIARLRAAAEHAPSDAHAWSDLAAAEYTTALRLGRASLYPTALDHADRALRIDPQSLEAAFNRALILERLGLTQQARDAWTRYLQIDPSSSWANEARDHLKRLPASTGASNFKRDQPQLERAAIAGDQRSVDAIVGRYRQQSRTWGEAEYLGKWGEADDAHQLTIARAIGDALARLSGESMLRDAVAAIDRASPLQRATLAKAHAMYRQGRLTYSHGQPAAAEPQLREAAAQFESARDPFALVARYYAANTRFDQNDVAGARRALESLRDEAGAHPQYRALGAHIRWELALCTSIDDDWSATEGLTSAAEQTFHELGESSSEAFMQMMRASALITLGRPDDGWALRAKAFAMQSAEARGDRLLVSISEAGNIALRSGGGDVAHALLSIEQAAYRAARDDAKLANALVRGAVIEATLTDDASAAQRSASEAMSVAERVSDPALRRRAVADANFAAGIVALRDDAPRAHALLTRAIDDYHATEYTLYLAEAHLMRARASMHMHDGDAALRDLEDGISARGAGSVIDARRALFDEIIPLRLDRGDVNAAFADAEKSVEDRHSWLSSSQSEKRGQARVSVLHDSAVLELIVLPRELVAFCATANGISVVRRAIVREAVGALAARDDDASLRELFDLLIRPSQPAIGHRSLIVVAGGALQDVPFAALIDATTKRHLIEIAPVAMALSASSLQTAAHDAKRSVVAIALPSGEASDSVALPEEEGELADVGALYAQSTRIESNAASFAALDSASPHADVIHIAGHTESRSSAAGAALLFRGRGAETDAVTWSRIAMMKLSRPIVVLAACNTLRTPAASQARALSLGAGFLAAGASSVIGTLTPIPDNEARAIFRSVHRELARGRGAAAALQQALIEAIAEESNGQRSAWRGVALLTNVVE